jgi:hypothetical protein
MSAQDPFYFRIYIRVVIKVKLLITEGSVRHLIIFILEDSLAASISGNH